ncbi:MAG: squalene--hopene cyclase [Bacteroidota bacterium]
MDKNVDHLQSDLNRLKERLDYILDHQEDAYQKQIDNAIENARLGVLKEQHAQEGYWCYELEADCTIPAEYILMMHYLGEVDEALQSKIANYIRKRQADDGGWPLYSGGKTDISCTVKAYYALKLAGDKADEPHMLRAKRAVLDRGGAAKSNVFTRIALATFEQIPWRGVPFIPAEIMLFPKWFPFHLSKVSYWSRTVMVPLFVIYSFKAKAKNPNQIDIRELFTTPPEKEKHYFESGSTLNKVILKLERIGYRMEPIIPKFLRKKALKKAERWFIDRLNGTSGLGAIFPAMVNAYEALMLLGYKKDHPYVKTAREAIDKLLVIDDQEAYCQPCVSPIWDTLLASCALQEVGIEENKEALSESLNWLKQKQILDGPADWKDYKPDLPSGGWAFQFDNDYYPDLDDTAFAAYALKRSSNPEFEGNIKMAADWLVGMQSKNGGFAAFDADNTYYYLNEIPFADHGALLDPPTADVSARVVMFLGTIVDDYPQYRDAMDKCIDYLTKEQEADGSWFGRWGTNYIYGTWSVLIAFEEAKIPSSDPRVTKAVEWLKSVQRPDGSWGEDNDSYEPLNMSGKGYKSAAFQTAWAVHALLTAGQFESEAVKNGINFLLAEQAGDGLWYDPEFTAPGFPRVFYLKYHGYDKYFPLWALARYRNELKQSEQKAKKVA